MIILFTMSILPVLLHGAGLENNGNKILQSCLVALDYLDNDDASGDGEAVKFCNDYLTGFRENENIKEIYMGERFNRGYCLPYKGVTNAELARVIVRFLQVNEQEQKLAANIAIRDALIEGYPCN